MSGHEQTGCMRWFSHASFPRTHPPFSDDREGEKDRDSYWWWGGGGGGGGGGEGEGGRGGGGGDSDGVNYWYEDG